MQARKYLVSRKEVMLAVTTDVLALVMVIFGAMFGIFMTLLIIDTKKDLVRMSREEHPTSIVTPETLHATFVQLMSNMVIAVEELSLEADCNDWNWSRDYYKNQAGYVKDVMLSFDYYVKGDMKKVTYIDRNNY
jgi:hypothetical protein